MAVTPAYGNLPAGVTLVFSNNDLSGNSLFSLRTGNGGTNTDASANWWGKAHPGHRVDKDRWHGG